MGKTRTKQRKPSARVRSAHFSTAYTSKTVPRQYKEAVPAMLGLMETWLTNQDAVEVMLFEELEDEGIPSELWPYYTALARRTLIKCLRFSCQTYELEAVSLDSEFVQRGLNAAVIDRTIDIAETVCMLVKETVVTLQDLEDKLDALLSDLAIIHFERHNRNRVYPQDVTAAITLVAAAAANTFGDWIEVIPLNTVPFPFHVIGLCICEVTAATNYHVQLGYNTIDAVPGANMEMGERRIRFAVVPIQKQSELLELRSQGIPANSKVWGRLKTASGNADEATISAVLTRHLEVSQPKALYSAFPW